MHDIRRVVNLLKSFIPEGVMLFEKYKNKTENNLLYRSL